VLPPAAGAGQTLTERNTLLGVGISTARVVGGKVQVDVAVTTYQTNASGIDDDAYMHPETRYTLMHSWRTIRADLATKYGRHILVNDGTRLGAGVAAVTPSIIKAEILSTYRKLELAGFVENFDFFAANLIVERNATNPNRLDALIPPDVANQFRQFASLVQFRLQA
jgi:phage tail sheath gpL-like